MQKAFSPHFSRLFANDMSIIYSEVFSMTKKELWDVFLKTGKVSDYLKYKNAPDRRAVDLDSMDMEAAEEFYLNNPHAEEFYNDDFNRWHSNQ